MSIRKTLFGYEIRDGRIAANDREADVVRRIFKLYRNGESYKSVADALNREGVPYSGDAPQWDKCKVKRTLENPRYAGRDGYPSIITKEDFQGVQAVIRTKSSGSKRNGKGKNPVALLKPYLKCELCDGQLIGVGGRNQEAGMTYLKCQGCGKAVTIRTSVLTEETERQIGASFAEGGSYVPSDEAMRLANAIDRSLEHPERPEETVALILQGVAAQYACCPNPAQRQFPKTLSDMGAGQIRKLVSHISVSQNGAISVCLKGRRRIV